MGESLKCDITTSWKLEYDFAHEELGEEHASEVAVRLVAHHNAVAYANKKALYRLHSWAVVYGYVEVVLVREVPA